MHAALNIPVFAGHTARALVHTHALAVAVALSAAVAESYGRGASICAVCVAWDFASRSQQKSLCLALLAASNQLTHAACDCSRPGAVLLLSC